MTAATVTVVCDLFDGSGAAITHGTAWFAPSVTLTDAAEGMYVPQAPVPAEFRSRVSPAVGLLPTDDASVLPSGWAWGVQFAYIAGSPSPYNFFLPSGPALFTAAAGTPCTLGWGTTAALTSLPNGSGVRLSGGSVPAAFGTVATYYVTGASGTTVSLATSRGGSAIASASVGSGALTVVQYNLSALSPAATAVTMAAYMPQPSGTPSAGQVPAATGNGEASQWTTLTGIAETVNTVAASGSAVTIPAPATATVSDVTLTANCTLTLPTATAGLSFTVLLRQDGTGGRTAAWTGTVKWPSGTAPALTAAPNAVDLLSFICVDAGTWLGMPAGFDFR